jgi:hypothetical protein
MTVFNSTLSGNSASGSGGGLNNNWIMTVFNSTLSGNSALGSGGGLFNDFGTMRLFYVTLASNSTGINYNGSVALTGTIVANSTAGPNCSGPLSEAQGYNLSSDTSCGLTQTTDITNTDPLLGPLANNGGPTPTMALQPGSPAIDHGGTSATGCPATDQRGLPRPDAQDGPQGQCDIGAFESQGIGVH